MAKNKKNKFKLRYVLILIILVSASFAFYKFFPEKFWVFTKFSYFYKLWFTIFAILTIK